MDDDDGPANPLDDLTDEELVARYKERVDEGALSIQLMRQVKRRGIECLDSDADMKMKVEALTAASKAQWNETLSKLDLGSIVSDGGLAEAARRLTATGPTFDTAALFGLDKVDTAAFLGLNKFDTSALLGIDTGGISEKFAGLSEPPAKFSDYLPSYEQPDYSEMIETIRFTSPEALNERLIDTLEVGFGTVQRELAEQRKTLDEQRDAQNHMKSSLATLKDNAPRSWTTWVILITACIAAVAGVAQLFRAP